MPVVSYPQRLGSLPANVGRVDGQVFAFRDSPGGVDQRLQRRFLERVVLSQRSGFGRHHPHHAREVGQRDEAVEGARLPGKKWVHVSGRQFWSIDM